MDCGTQSAGERTDRATVRNAAGSLGKGNASGGPPGGRRSHRQLGRNPLGRATRRSVRGSSGCAGGNRTTLGWLALATLPRSLSSLAPLPNGHAARGKSFRPTASRTHRQSTLKSLQKCSSKPPMADISIWQKTGHFYFALTLPTLPTLLPTQGNPRTSQGQNVS